MGHGRCFDWGGRDPGLGATTICGLHTTMHHVLKSTIIGHVTSITTRSVYAHVTAQIWKDSADWMKQAVSCGIPK